MVTLQELKKYLGLESTSEHDGQLSAVINGLPAYVKLMTGRVFGDPETVTETHDWSPTIFLNNIDVSAIEFIKVGYQADHNIETGTDLTELQNTDYRWNAEGRISLSNYFYKHKTKYDYDSVHVKYTYGVEDVPEDIKLAAMMFAGDAFSAIDGEVSSERLGDYSKSYKPSSAAQRIFDTNRMVNI